MNQHSVIGSSSEILTYMVPIEVQSAVAALLRISSGVWRSLTLCNWMPVGGECDERRSYLIYEFSGANRGSSVPAAKMTQFFGVDAGSCHKFRDINDAKYEGGGQLAALTDGKIG
jgi:hypothetical protein